MLRFNLAPIFKARGIDKPFNYLTANGFHNHTAHNLINAKVSSFQFKNIDKLCTLLHCTPNDLIVWSKNPNEHIADNHPLTKLKNKQGDFNWQDTIKTLPLEQLKDLVQIIKSAKEEPKKENPGE